MNEGITSAWQGRDVWTSGVLFVAKRPPLTSSMRPRPGTRPALRPWPAAVRGCHIMSSYSLRVFLSHQFSFGIFCAMQNYLLLQDNCNRLSIGRWLPEWADKVSLKRGNTQHFLYITSKWKKNRPDAFIGDLRNPCVCVFRDKGNGCHHWMRLFLGGMNEGDKTFLQHSKRKEVSSWQFSWDAEQRLVKSPS